MEESDSGSFHTLGKRASERTRGFESRLLRHVINFLKKFKRGWDVEIHEVNFLRHRLQFMFYYTYILQSQKDKSLYIGYTLDLRKRFKEHNEGKSLATKPFRPYRLIFYEAFLNRTDTKNREIYLKSGYGGRSIKALLKEFLKNT